jgi:hypothetical protein
MAQESATDLECRLTQAERELSEAREQQAATAEVLRIISSSPGDLEPVFRAMLKNATRICGAKFGVLFRFEGGLFHPAALLDVPPVFADFLARQGSFAPEPGRLFGRLSQTKKAGSTCLKTACLLLLAIVLAGGVRAQPAN